MYTDENLFSITNDDVVDIIGADCYFRLRWKENKKMILQGSSFCTAVIMNKLLASRKKFHTKQSAKEYLKSIAQSELIEQDCYDTNRIYNFVKNIHRAVIFPFNKEIHSLAAFENMLDFQVERYYDVREKMLVGKKISDILNYCDNSKCICDINSLCWEDEFDTIICGHLFEIQSLLKRNYIEKIIEKSKIYRKKVFFFDDISTYLIDKNKNEMICSVNAVKYYCPQVRDGMLAINGTPTVAVLGTSSKQGKYTIQLSLRNELMKRGYDVGVLGTEPSSFLFGFDETYAYGYGNMMNTLNDETTHIVNEMIRKINSQGRDIIITGAQSGMIPYYLTNTKMYTSKQLEFLLGVNPDTYILCVNSIDTIEYIKKTISFIESVTEAELAGIVISERLKSQGENFHIQDKLCECFGRNIIYYLEDMDIRRLGDSVIKRYKEW